MQSQANLRARFAAVAALAMLWMVVSWAWPKFLFLQSDTFWLIETGRYILEHRALPAHDIYSFTRSGSEWVVYQWLFELILAGLFQIGGWLLISLFGTLTVGWLFFVDIPRTLVALKANALVIVAVVVLGLLASLPDIVALRPQMLTFVLLWLTQRLLNRDGSAQDRSLWLLVPIMVVWVNVHISFVIEIAVLAVYACAAAGARLFGRGVPKTGTIPRSWTAAFTLAALLAACSLASLLNPYGPHIYDFLAHSWQDQNITPELRPLDWTNNPALLGYLVLAGLSILLCVRRCNAAQLLCAFMLLAAGLSGARFILYFVVWSIPIVCQALTRFSTALTGRREAMLRTVSDGLSLGIRDPAYPLAVFLSVGLITTIQPTQFPSIIPVRAAEYLTQHRPSGRIFCGEHAGSYLIFRFRGDIPVFIDTRADVYGRDFCEMFRQAMLTGRQWDDLVDRLEIRAALIPQRYPLAMQLETSKVWHAVYRDDTYSVFVYSPEPNRSKQGVAPMVN